jgi:multidrug resistance protein MdtO
MVRMFARSARLVGTLTSISASQSGIAQIRTLREEIAASFASVNGEADAVLFESGANRLSYLVARERIRRWLSTLRTLYLLELPMLPFSPVEEQNQLSPGDRKAEVHSRELVNVTNSYCRMPGTSAWR